MPLGVMIPNKGFIAVGAKMLLLRLGLLLDNSSLRASEFPPSDLDKNLKDLLVGELHSFDSEEVVLPSILESEEFHEDKSVVGAPVIIQGGSGIQDLEAFSTHWSTSLVLGRFHGFRVQQRSSIIHTSSVNHAPSAPRGQSGRLPSATCTTTTRSASW